MRKAWSQFYEAAPHGHRPSGGSRSRGLS